MSAVKKFQADALYRENIFGAELIWKNRRYILPNARGRSHMKNLFIYAMVKKDAMNYLKKHKLRKLKWEPSVTYNNDAVPGERTLIGTDIDGAYWFLAREIGAITDNTYEKGFLITEKHILVSSLSTLGRDKRYHVLKDGTFTNDIVIVKGNEDLKQLYKTIRYACFQYMKQLAKLLKNDFVAYKTDCIYYFHSKKNVSIVKKFLDEKGLDYKMVQDFDSFHDHVD